MEHIVSIDAGNGGTNGVLAGKKSDTMIYFPSVRAAATGDTLGLGSQFEMQYEYVDWGKHRYVVGDDVLRVSRKAIERHQGAFRYGDEFHQFLVAVTCARLGIKSGEVDLTLFAPPGMFREASEEIKESFMMLNGNVALKMSGDKSPRKWKYTSVTVWPEGIGAAACFAIDKDGKHIPNNDTLDGETVILDMGMPRCPANELRELQP
jgi:hypothetical protein